MADLADGESVEVQGSARLPYVMKNIGGVYSCSCPAWRNQSLPIDRRSCKHLMKMRGEAAEQQRTGGAKTVPAAMKTKPIPPALLLAESWDGESDVASWWLSEKLDGTRAWWAGGRFLSRQGNVFHAPAWFTAGLPSELLDGELWIARKAFQRTVSVVRRQDGGELWRDVRFLVFDAPAVDKPFERRLQFLHNTLGDSASPYAAVLDQRPCRDGDHLRAELDRILALGGEGLMLRQPGSRYESGRSSTLLKVKRFHDAEATVVEHLPGAGRHKGRLGALLVCLENGKQFSVGTGFTDVQREHPPVIGSIITFRYQELTDGGVPRFPTFVRVRSEDPVTQFALK